MSMQTNSLKTMTKSSDFIPVLHVVDYFDDPSSGVADYSGKAHWFHCEDEYCWDGATRLYRLRPMDPTWLALEREQASIWVEWRSQFDAGLRKLDSHPGKVNDRFIELKAILGPIRRAPVAESVLASGEFKRESGTRYLVRWGEPTPLLLAGSPQE